MTDDEIWKFWCNRPAVPEGEDDSMEAEFVSAVRAIIAAYQEKLRQGVELPEPDTDEPASNYFGKPCYYTEETLQQYGDSRYQAGYLRGLEDAKRAVVKEIDNWDDDRSLHICAAAIDKLKGGE